MKVPRRSFLLGCGGFAAASAFESASAPRLDYHVDPRYREQAPIESVVRKRMAAYDDFAGERNAEKLAAILQEWSGDLCQGKQRTSAIEKALSVDFAGSSFRSASARAVRTGGLISSWQLSFEPGGSLGPRAFADELREYLRDLAQILTAEFQITRIAASGSQIETSIRYEIVGAGEGFFREGRTGLSRLTWNVSADRYSIVRWQQITEARSRSHAPVYVDMAEHALGGNESYGAQLLHGVDYWRTVLDGACGIDIYGHNGVSAGDVYGRNLDDLYICQPAGLPNRLYRNKGDGTFEDVTEASGVGVLENTACALFVDVDNDGRQDLVVVCANGPLLFLNEGGGRFREKASAFRFASAPQGTFTGAAVADYDRDGWLDIYFCLYVFYQGAEQYKYPTPYYDANNGPPNFLMRNNRNGTFRDVTGRAGLNQNNTRYSFCCEWIDADQNGWPDLYVVNDFGRKNLYRNNGDGTFTDVAAVGGVEDVGAGMSVCSFDYDNDGAPDLYVANMWTAAGERVTAEDRFHPEANAKARAFYRKHAMGNSLFQNRPENTSENTSERSAEGVFTDRSAAAGVGIGRWSWSSDAWDFDHDGFTDLYVTNGMISGPNPSDLNSFFWRQVVAKSPDVAQPSRSYEQGWTAVNELIREDYSWSGFERNMFYANNGDGTFTDVSGAIGLDFVEDGRSFALADFDGDGRLEVVVKNRNAPQIRLLRNVVQDLPPSICFVLRGTRSNRDAIGATVTITTEGGRQTRTLQAGSGFLSQHTKQIFFGLGAAKASIAASVRWPSGKVQRLEGLAANQRVFVEEGSEVIRTEAFHVRAGSGSAGTQPSSEVLPNDVQTWMLTPVSAPDISLSSGDGSTSRLSDYHGHPVFLHLWTSRSAECREGLRALEQVSSEWAAHGIRIVAVRCEDVQSADDVLETNRKEAYPFPVLRASEEMTAVYNLLYRWLFDRHRDMALPTSFLIDEEGTIIKIYRGAVSGRSVWEDLRGRPRSPEERMRKGLPFAPAGHILAFGRNYLSLGSLYFQRGYFEQAQSSFQTALHEDSQSAEAQYGLGSAYLKQSKIELARDCFERAVKLVSAYPDTKPNAWNNLGLLTVQAGRTDEALGFFEQALRVQPDHLISLENLGNAYRKEQRWEEARSVLEKAVALAPDDPDANYSLAMVFAQIDQPDRAHQLLQRALALRPGFPEAMNNLGVLYLRTRRRDDAVALFTECMRVAPGFEQSYLNLARVYAIEGDKAKAREVLQSLLKVHPHQQGAEQALESLK